MKKHNFFLGDAKDDSSLWHSTILRSLQLEQSEGQICREVGQAQIQKNPVDHIDLYTKKIADHFDVKTYLEQKSV